MSLPLRVPLALALCIAALAGAPARAADVWACKADALGRAAKLLAFHTEGDDRAAVDETSLKRLPPLRNPANKKQRLEVLEVQGHVYKGDYRMRFIYHVMPGGPGGCVLMGQEILALASL